MVRPNAGTNEVSNSSADLHAEKARGSPTSKIPAIWTGSLLAPGVAFIIDTQIQPPEPAVQCNSAGADRIIRTEYNGV